MKKITKKQLMILLSVVCAAVFMASAGVLAATFVSATTAKITVEVGEEPDPQNIHESDFLSSLYTVEPYSIDVTEPGEHRIDLRFFGFLPGEVTVEVCDTIPPELILTDIMTVEGTAITAEDFVVSCTDSTSAEIAPVPENI
ncbi:MAG: hypothetical protein IKI93_03300, partial [Clostridia bacterium]|nr:hypothetical protein [Clostridia bacterium]